MNYQKLDAGLISAIEDAKGSSEAELPVFIRTSESLTAEQAEALATVAGVRQGKGQTVVTATLAPSAIAALSDYPWVLSIQLSQQARLYTEQRDARIKPR